MVLDKNGYQMEIITKDNTNKVNLMDKANILGSMEPNIQDNFPKDFVRRNSK
jgi:hypothetical protein